MILAARLINDTLGIASAAQQRQSDAVIQLIRQGMSRERAHAKISGRWGDLMPATEAKPEPVHIGPPPIAHVYAWHAYQAQQAAQARQKLSPPDTILQPTISAVVGIVSEVMQVPVAALYGYRRSADVTLARHAAAAMCRRWTACSLSQIGRTFSRDHATIIWACDALAMDMAAGQQPSIDAFNRCDAAIRSRYPKAAHREKWGNPDAARVKARRMKSYHTKGATT